MKKVLMCGMLASVLCTQGLVVNAESKILDKKLVYTLEKESYEGNAITRIYNTEEGQFQEDIDIPLPLREKLKQSSADKTNEQMLFEAKKEMFIAYYVLGLNERMKVLNVERLEDLTSLPPAKSIVVPEDYRAKMQKEFELFRQEAVVKKQEWLKLTPKEQKEIYDVQSDKMSVGFLDLQSGSDKPKDTPEIIKNKIHENEMGYKQWKEHVEKKEKKQQKNSNEDSSKWIWWTGAIGGATLIGAFSFWLLRKKNPRK
ncbi:hypothetical protein bcgnr5378_36820 [Bacillus cereus]|uniref:Uncharacterized protein n=1 Tax=Bacillus cereus TaxID=1396 RepID=A0A161SYX6_BACCE|nr:hypothetical protein [Bacillus cereus]KZD71985.1 hypothetical protein B4088_0446 [Bacillus cereus]HDR8322065.1 hypothetical protein [Bacillus cereus]HDR8328615.1 hypothetical protein [Bacillus cereus]HDR8334251.1 hypothetical protein [Bacillus cereus]